MSETLTPWTMLFSNVVKMVCALAILALDIVVYVQRTDGHYSLIGLGLDGAFMYVNRPSYSVSKARRRRGLEKQHTNKSIHMHRIAVVTIAAYSIRTHRRLSAFDEYQFPANAKPYGFTDEADGRTSYGSQLALKPNAEPEARRLSAGSFHSVRSQKEPSVEMNRLSRSPSYYNHERDTQFDDYMASRASLNLKEDVERALSAEFGWGSTSPPEGDRDALERSGSIVLGSGVVQTAKVRPTGESMARAVSWETAHVLVAVPEDDEEPVDTKPAQKEGGSDRVALLSDQERRDSDAEKTETRSTLYEVDGGDLSQTQKPKWDTS
jgi:hypothetical protein